MRSIGAVVRLASATRTALNNRASVSVASSASGNGVAPISWPTLQQAQRRRLCTKTAPTPGIREALALYSHQSPSVLEFFDEESGGFNKLAPDVKDAYVTLLVEKHRHKLIFEEFHKGEITVQESARRMGLVIPTSGEYVGQLVPPGQGGHKMKKNKSEGDR